MSLSMYEYEYIEAYSSSTKVVWIQKFLIGMFDLDLEVTCIFFDNQSCLKLSKILAFHDKSQGYQDQVPLYPRHGREGIFKD